MKKIILYFIIATMMLGTSCNDKLDLLPTDQFAEDDVWTNRDAMELYVTGFYALLRDAAEINGSLSDGYSDILKYRSHITTTHNQILLDKDYITVTSNPLSAWGNYSRIKRHNEFLYIAPKKATVYTEDEMTVRLAEIRFLRAFAYYRMIRSHGGVVLRDEVGGVDSEAQKDKARATEAESWDFVLKDLEYAAKYLPESWPNEWNGRANKGAAYALMSRCAVYAKQWDVAIQAVEELQALGKYDLLDDYKMVFQEDDQNKNKEVILGVYFKKPNYTHIFDRNYVPRGDGSTVGCLAMPTSELVDAYEMKDGTPFDWATYGSDPYTDRDPRFYATVLYNGATWKNRKINTASGGSDAFTEYNTTNDPAKGTVTGYYVRKYLKETNSYFDDEKSDQFWSELRYAEVLLNYAEALAEKDYSANAGAALSALNLVRNRKGNGLPDITLVTDKDDFMEKLRHERMIELALEGHRYWDLRRWRLAHLVIDGQQAHGVTVSSGTYKQVECDAKRTRYFPEKYYLTPIPKEEVNNNELCDQNPYW